MQMTYISHLKDWPSFILLGGEKQRARIVMALEQKTKILLLDEPLTYLEIVYQFEVLDLLHTINDK